MGRIFNNEFYAQEKGFVELWGDECEAIFGEGKLMNIPIKFLKNEDASHVPCDNSPFACNYCGHQGYRYIVYNFEVIKHYELTQLEQYAFVAHEVGHMFLNHNDKREDNPLINEINADNFAVKLGLIEPLISGLQKIIELNSEEISERILSLQKLINNTCNYENN